MPTISADNPQLKTFQCKGITFPLEAFGKSYQQAKLEAGCGPDQWYTNHSRRFRELLVENGCSRCAGIDEDKLCGIAVLYRKRGFWKRYCRERGIAEEDGGSRLRKKPKISPELAAHYQSEDYRRKREQEFFQHPRCRVCGVNMAEECHHSRYDRIGTPAESADIIAVCKVCHPVLDSLRERNRAEQRRLEKQLMTEINAEYQQ